MGSQSIVYQNTSSDAILILIFFLTFYYSPEQNSVWWQALFWISHFFLTVEKIIQSKTLSHKAFVYFSLQLYGTGVFFIVLKLVELEINLACHPSLSIHKTCSRKIINDISGRKKTTELPSIKISTCKNLNRKICD